MSGGPRCDDVTADAEARARLLSRPCDTCVIFPDDRMHLGERRQEFIEEALRRDSYVVCHDTIGRAPAICRGFWNAHRRDTWALRMYVRHGHVVEVDPPTREEIVDVRG